MWIRRTKGIDEAIEAVNSAALAVKEVKSRDPETKALGDSFRIRRADNHFAERIEELFSRG